MNEPSPLGDPNLQRLVQDFDALADLVQTLIARNRRPPQHEPLPAQETQFTTEWQIEPNAEMAHSF